VNGFLIDANVLLDIATADPTWMTWSQEQLRSAAGRGAVFINPIIYAELAPAFTNTGELDRWLDLM
jgi:predicted nucleic acid-binding protein